MCSVACDIPRRILYRWWLVDCWLNVDEAKVAKKFKSRQCGEHDTAVLMSELSLLQLKGTPTTWGENGIICWRQLASWIYNFSFCGRIPTILQYLSRSFDWKSYDYVDEKDGMAPVETKQIRWSDRRSTLETFGGWFLNRFSHEQLELFWVFATTTKKKEGAGKFAIVHFMVCRSFVCMLCLFLWELYRLLNFFATFASSTLSQQSTNHHR